MSATKFLWRSIRHSHRKSWKHFKRVGDWVTNLIYVIGALVVFKLTSKELGDTMIYWALSVPVILWWVYFVWHSIKFHHRVNLHFPKIVAVIFLLLLASLIAALVELSSIKQLKSQISDSEKIAQKQISTTKPAPKILPEIVVPRPEPSPPPMPAIPTQQLANVQTQAPLQVYIPDTNLFWSSNSIAAKIKSDKAAKAAKDEVDRQQHLLEIQNDWNYGVKHYQRAVTASHNILLTAVAQNGDGIASSDGYEQCIPESIDPKKGEIKAATIGWQKNTNMNFSITITGLNGAGHRQVYISCAAGNLQLNPSHADNFYIGIHIPEIEDDGGNVPMDKSDNAIAESIKKLVMAQYAYLSDTNNQ